MSHKSDLFHVAIEKGIDIFVPDISIEHIAKIIPSWYQKRFYTQTFILLPIMVNGRAVGLLYGDKKKSGDLIIEHEELRLLHKLRKLSSDALIKKHMRAAGESSFS